MTHRSPSPFASDDRADSLLADILDETADAAQREEAELERSLAEREAKKRRAREEKRARRLAERQAKLEKEMQRQAELQKRRTQKLEALSEPDPEATEEPPATDRPEMLTPDPEELRREIREQVRREFENTPLPTQAAVAEAEPKRRSLGPAFTIAAVLLAGVIGATAFAMTAQYEPDRNTYAKAVFAPAEHDVVAMEVGSTPIPAAEPVVTEKEEKPKPKRVRTKPRVRKTPEKTEIAKSETKSPWAKPKQNDANKSLSRFLEDAPDPFTADE